jgi:serine protease AprX
MSSICVRHRSLSSRVVICVLLLSLLAPVAIAAPTVDSALTQYLQDSPLSSVPVVITYSQHPSAADIASLQMLGIPGGVVLNRLPMVLTAINKAQLDALRNRSNIVSIFPNQMMELDTSASRTFIGVTALRKDAEVTKRNGGLPISGKGVGVAIVDTGIDATHPDLQLGRNVVQNVSFPLSDLAVVGNCPAAAAGIVGISGVPGVVLNLGFLPPTFVEDAPISDAEGGHGTFVAGVVGGTGQASGGFYGGMAPGANLVGLVAGNDCGLPSFGILQAFDYVVVNQIRFNIRVVNNSWGSRLRNVPYDPNHPINVATRTLHDLNITVVFSAGNAGATAGAINPYSTAPWTISVAASQKEGLGLPSSFSSRGEDNGTGTDVAGQPADPNAPPNLRPDLTAPGEDIKSTRSKGPGLTNVADSPVRRLERPHHDPAGLSAFLYDFARHKLLRATRDRGGGADD